MTHNNCSKYSKLSKKCSLYHFKCGILFVKKNNKTEKNMKKRIELRDFSAEPPSPI